jgi:hypothetical protein
MNSGDLVTKCATGTVRAHQAHMQLALQQPFHLSHLAVHGIGRRIVVYPPGQAIHRKAESVVYGRELQTIPTRAMRTEASYRTKLKK